MSFFQAVRSVLFNAFTFSGRSSRSEYWWFVLFYVVVLSLAAAADADKIIRLITNLNTKEAQESATAIITLITKFGMGSFESADVFTAISSSWYLSTYFVLLIPFLSVTTRRLHDTGRSFFFIFKVGFASIGLFIGTAFLIGFNIDFDNLTDVNLMALNIISDIIVFGPSAYYYLVMCFPSAEHNEYGPPAGDERFYFTEDSITYVNGAPTLTETINSAHSARELAKSYYAERVQSALNRDKSSDEIYRVKYDFGPDLQES